MKFSVQLVNSSMALSVSSRQLRGSEPHAHPPQQAHCFYSMRHSSWESFKCQLSHAYEVCFLLSLMSLPTPSCKECFNLGLLSTRHSACLRLSLSVLSVYTGISFLSCHLLLVVAFFPLTPLGASLSCLYSILLIFSCQL